MPNSPKYQQTDQKIQNVFLQLVQKYGYQKTSVRMIIAECQINRSTFYAHYLDKPDLMEKIQNQLLDRLLNDLPPLDFQLYQKANMAYQRIAAMADRVYAERQLFSLLLSDQADGLFAQHLLQRAEQEFDASPLTDHLAIPKPYLLATTSSLIINLFVTWIRRDFAESPAEFTKIAQKVSVTTVRELVANTGD
ncbi:TetR/AcrR family transcriptional regulator [Lactobacillaceae bacterium L1_55_11]|nr:TetR/AcrR family transcriptional regulator [Lactobacillaceae bacterium L1_55_11]